MYLWYKFKGFSGSYFFLQKSFKVSPDLKANDIKHWASFTVKGHYNIDIWWSFDKQSNELPSISQSSARLHTTQHYSRNKRTIYSRLPFHLPNKSWLRCYWVTEDLMHNLARAGPPGAVQNIILYADRCVIDPQCGRRQNYSSLHTQVEFE